MPPTEFTGIGTTACYTIKNGFLAALRTLSTVREAEFFNSFEALIRRTVFLLKLSEAKLIFQSPTIKLLLLVVMG